MYFSLCSKAKNKRNNGSASHTSVTRNHKSGESVQFGSEIGCGKAVLHPSMLYCTEQVLGGKINKSEYIYILHVV